MYEHMGITKKIIDVLKIEDITLTRKLMKCEFFFFEFFDINTMCATKKKKTSTTLPH
jgi:hypothetical protein